MKKSLGTILIERKLLTAEQLDAALQEQKVSGARLGKVLVRNGFLRQKILLDILHEISPESMHEESVFLPNVPIEFLKATKTMITADLGDQVYVATMSPPALVKHKLRECLAGREIIFAPVNPVRLAEYLSKLSENINRPLGDWDALVHSALEKNHPTFTLFLGNFLIPSCCGGTAFYLCTTKAVWMNTLPWLRALKTWRAWIWQNGANPKTAGFP